MCNGINKSNGKQCGRKAEWCSQHISQKPAEPIAEPVAEQKNEEPELIQAEKEIVETIIVPPTSMSPNATSITATVPELPIVEAEKSEPVENNSTDRIHRDLFINIKMRMTLMKRLMLFGVIKLVSSLLSVMALLVLS
jgi:hypothetical protein